MNRLSLRWIVLVPILATITVGFLAFAIYIDHSDRHTRLAAIDEELAPRANASTWLHRRPLHRTARHHPRPPSATPAPSG